MSNSVCLHGHRVTDNFLDEGVGMAVQWRHCNDSSFCGSLAGGDLEEGWRRGEGGGLTLQRDSCLHQRQLNLMGGVKEVRWRGGDVIFGSQGS